MWRCTSLHHFLFYMLLFLAVSERFSKMAKELQYVWMWFKRFRKYLQGVGLYSPVKKLLIFSISMKVAEYDECCRSFAVSALSSYPPCKSPNTIFDCVVLIGSILTVFWLFFLLLVKLAGDHTVFHQTKLMHWPTLYLSTHSFF